MRQGRYTRREMMAAPAAVLAACRPRRTFSGFAFVANHDGRAIAAVDLGVFGVAKEIPIDGQPAEIVAADGGARVLALSPDNAKVHEIAVERLAVSRSAAFGNRAAGMRLSRDGKSIFVLCSDPQRLVSVSTATLRAEWQIPLPAEPFDADLSPDGKWLAVSYGARQFLERIDLGARASAGAIRMDGPAGILRFQSDSSQLLAANPSERMLNVYQAATGRLVVKLPLAVRPDHFCFNADGGQLFVTGEGGNAVVVVYPYFTPQVGETVLAGRAPGAMAVTPELLFIANSRSSDVSILQIESRKLLAVAPAGTDPSFIAVTPDNQYALVLNQGSGDMGVIWIPSITRTRARSAALFTLIPVGSKPVSAAIVAV